MSTHKQKLSRPLNFNSFRDLEPIFGPATVLHGEDPEAFFTIGQALWNARPPEDFVQATRIYDITYLLWEGNRLRRLKVKLIEASQVEGAKKLIKRLDGKWRDDSYWSGWALGEQETVDYVNSLLTAVGLDQEAILAQTIETLVDTLETIERQSAQFEARRLVITRELDQYSDNLVRRRLNNEERNSQINDDRPKNSKLKKKQEPQAIAQLPLGLTAAE